MEWSRADLVGRVGWHLLDVDLGGQVRRYTDADQDQTITNAAGLSFVYRCGLVVSGTGAVFGVAVEASVSVSIYDETDWAKLEAEDVFLDERAAVLRRWHEGMELDLGRVLLRGVTGASEYGAIEDPWTFTVSRSLRRRSLLIPRPRMKVNAKTWPDSGNYVHDERIRGSYYPVLLGHPGARAGSQTSPGAPAWLVQVSAIGGENEDKLLIAGHRVAGSHVRIFDYTNADHSRGTNVAITHEPDALGRVCAIANLSGSSLSGSVALGRVYYQGHKISDGGGMVDPRTNAVIRGAGSVLRYLLEAWTKVVVDGPQMDVAAEYLDAFKVDAAIFQPGRAMDWLNGKLLPLLPCQLREGANGLFPQVFRFDATSTDVVASLSADRDQIRRVSTLRRVGTIRNEFALHYRQDAASKQHRATAALSGEPGRLKDARWKDRGDLDARVLGSFLCRASQARFGRLPAGELTTDIIWDPTTAALILQWMAARDTFPRRLVQYEAGEEWAWLPLGAVVTVTDEEVALIDRLALVTDYFYSAGSILLQLTLLDHPVSHTRDTP